MNDFSEYFKDVNNFFVHKQRDHITTCYICSEEHNKTYKRLYEHLYQCEKCNFVWLAQRPNTADLEEFYRRSAAMSKWATIKSGNFDKDRQDRKYRFFYDQITYRGLDSILDVGCGSGRFLSGLPEDCDGIGVEPNKDSAAQCDSPVVDCSTKLTGNYDLITYMGVLEHLEDPKSVIKKYEKFSNEDGLIGIIVPNIESLAFKLIQDKICTICPQHLYYFSIKSLDDLMLECGYCPIMHETVESELQPIIKMEKYGDPYLDTGWEYNHDTYTEVGILEKNQGAKILALYGKVNL